MLRWEDYTNAGIDLSKSALNLYMYLAKNIDGYTFFLSSKDYCDTFNVVDKTYRNAKNELIKKGYLKEMPHNKFIFDAAGHLNENKEDLKKKLLSLSEQLDEDGEDELKKRILKINLSQEKDDSIYCQKISTLISFCEEYLKSTRQTAIGKYL